jgi:hypothetical protein
MCVCGRKAHLLSECPLKTPPVEGEWPEVVRLLSSKRRPHFKTHESLGKNNSTVLGPDGTRNQDWLCWWRPAAIYPTDQCQLQMSTHFIFWLFSFYVHADRNGTDRCSLGKLCSAFLSLLLIDWLIDLPRRDSICNGYSYMVTCLSENETASLK